MVIVRQLGHLTSMKNELGVGTSLFNLCLSFWFFAVGCNRSVSMSGIFRGKKYVNERFVIGDSEK